MTDNEKQSQPENQKHLKSVQAIDSINDGWTSGRLAKEMLVAAKPKKPSKNE
ncbi:MAG: hypothetical protein KAR25_05380 [Methanosarcinales archaeon]|nr:hypothetical protein [Methanosarcinales archaeon]